MSWRSLSFCAVVIVVLYGAGSVVFSSGSPDREPGRSRSVHSGNVQQRFDLPTPYPLSSEEIARCARPTDVPAGTRYLCQIDRAVEVP
jgi:hypothetical protein